MFHGHRVTWANKSLTTMSHKVIIKFPTGGLICQVWQVKRVSETSESPWSDHAAPLRRLRMLLLACPLTTIDAPRAVLKRAPRGRWIIPVRPPTLLRPQDNRQSGRRA